MSRNGSIELELGGEERTFRFDIAAHERLQEKLDMGISLIVQNLHPYVAAVRAGFSLAQALDAKLVGDLRKDQISAVVFHGLIGGGLDPKAAKQLTKQWVDDRPLLENVELAYSIGLASMIGVPDEDPAGEQTGETPRHSPEENSVSDKAASTP